MSYQIRWSESALKQASELLRFLAEENPPLAERVIEDLFRRVEVLREQPRLGRPLERRVLPDVRRLVLGHYIVLYHIGTSQEIIWIIAVRHSRQRSLREEED